MKLKAFILLVFLCVFNSCDNTPPYPSTDIEVARAFINDILQNNYKDAKRFVLDEEMNNQYFELSKKQFEAKSKDELLKYKESDIVVNEIKQVNDSATIVNFSNTYKRAIKNEVKVIKLNGKWSVDLKHTFQ